MRLCGIGCGDDEEESEKKGKGRELHDDDEGREQLGHRDPGHGGHLFPALVTPREHIICNWT